MYFEDEEADRALVAGLEGGPASHPLQCVFEGPASYETTFALINRYNAASEFADLGFRAGQWFETTEHVYWYFLECLPPLIQTHFGFVVSECVTGDLYDGFIEVKGRFYCVVTRAPEHGELRALYDQIRAGQAA